MDATYYERKINDVITKCPIEAGIEILVYNVLDSIVESRKLSLVDINSLQKNHDKRLSDDDGASDIAILSKDFKYKDYSSGFVYGLVETKLPDISLLETNQVKVHKGKVKHYLYTNGLIWKYYKNSNEIWSINLFPEYVKDKKRKIDSDAFANLLYKLNEIQWSN